VGRDVVKREVGVGGRMLRVGGNYLGRGVGLGLEGTNVFQPEKQLLTTKFNPIRTCRSIQGLAVITSTNVKD
jgi:hypothetical protein